MSSIPKKSISPELSSIISFLRFPLIFCVVVLHTHLPMDDNLKTIVYKILPPCIPILFLISSYLFFYSFEGWNWKLFKEKIRSRFHSLFVPYLFWNAFALLFYFLVHQLFSEQISSSYQNVSQFTAIDFLRAFWNGFDGNPIAYQLWFLRDLMVLFLLAPLFYFLLRGRLGWVLIALFISNEIFQFVIDFKLRSITWFAIGAFLAIRQFDVLKYLKDSRYVIIVLYLVFLVASFVSDAFFPYSSFIGVFAAFDIVRLLIKKGLQMPRPLTEVSFFEYAFHGCTILIITKAIGRLFDGNQLLLAFGYFLAPVMMTILCVVIYYSLKRLFPRFTNIIVGKRMKFASVGV